MAPPASCSRLLPPPQEYAPLEEEKKADRRKRFGILSEAEKKAEEAERLKTRKDRFGLMSDKERLDKGEGGGWWSGWRPVGVVMWLWGCDWEAEAEACNSGATDVAAAQCLAWPAGPAKLAMQGLACMAWHAQHVCASAAL